MNFSFWLLPSNKKNIDHFQILFPAQFLPWPSQLNSHFFFVDNKVSKHTINCSYSTLIIYLLSNNNCKFAFSVTDWFQTITIDHTCILRSYCHWVQSSGDRYIDTSFGSWKIHGWWFKLWYFHNSKVFYSLFKVCYHHLLVCYKSINDHVRMNLNSSNW